MESIRPSNGASTPTIASPPPPVAVGARANRTDYAASAKMVNEVLALGSDAPTVPVPERPAAVADGSVHENRAAASPADGGPLSVPEIDLPPPPPPGPLSPDFFNTSSEPKKRHWWAK